MCADIQHHILAGLMDMFDDWPSTSFRQSMVKRIGQLLDASSAYPYETCPAQQIELATFQRSSCKVEYMKMLARAINAIRDNRWPYEKQHVPEHRAEEWVPPDPKPSVPEAHMVTS
ncbi:hypothetical protein AAVH_22012 [Aphelenchoides avenae]|nr:hypothetical protein AAVH_22012 [Aphelenchus avenae]